MSFDPYAQWLSIPADQRPPDHYQLLGLTQLDPDVDTIKAAALDRMAAVRRYQLGQHSETAIRLMGELARAFDCLTDPARRTAYDEELLSRNGGDEWFCQVMGEELGPMTRADLDQMIEQRRVTPHDLVRNGSGNWFLARDLWVNGESAPAVPEKLWRIIPPPTIKLRPAANDVPGAMPATPTASVVDTSQGIAAIVIGLVSLALAPAGLLSYIASAVSIAVALVGLWLTQRDWRTLAARGGNGFGFTVTAVVVCLLAIVAATTAAYMRYDLGQAGPRSFMS